MASLGGVGASALRPRSKLLALPSNPRRIISDTTVRDARSGLEKLWGFAGGRIDRDLSSIHGIAGLIETPGELLLMLGLFTRTTAFILCREMAVAYFHSWAPRGFWPITNGGERIGDLLLHLCDRSAQNRRRSPAIPGLFTRLTTVILCIELAAAYLSSSLLRAPWPIRNGGEEAVLYFSVFLYFAAAGAGAWSLDHLIEKTKPNRRESSLTIGAAVR